MPSELTPLLTLAWATLLINDFTAQDAVHAALNHAKPWSHGLARIFPKPIAASLRETRDVFLDRGCRRAEWIKPGPGKPGAWEVRLSSLILLNSAPGAAPHQSIGAHAALFVGADPHLEPHAEDRPEHWAAARLALAEEEALAHSTPPPSSAQPRMNHAL